MAALRRFLAASPGEAKSLRREALEALRASPDPEAWVRAAFDGAAGVPAQNSAAVPGGTGSYRVALRLPRSYGGPERWPVVVGLHPAVQGPAAGDAFCDSAVLQGLRGTAVVLCPRLAGRAWDSPAGEDEVNAVLDWAARDLRTDPDAVLLAGYSLGGHGVWYLAGRIPDRLAAALPVAGAPRHPEQLENARGVRLLAVNGLADQIVEPRAAGIAAARLRELGGDATSILTPGDHFDVARHADALEPYLDRLRGARRESHPRKLEWVGSGPQRFYWLEVREVSGPARAAARIEPGRIVLETEAVKRLALLLSPALVSFDTLSVVWNGQVAYEGAPRADPGTLLDQARARPDPRALVSAVIELAAPGVEVHARAM